MPEAGDTRMAIAGYVILPTALAAAGWCTGVLLWHAISTRAINRQP